jgi:hypothetical protein
MSEALAEHAPPCVIAASGGQGKGAAGGWWVQQHLWDFLNVHVDVIRHDEDRHVVGIALAGRDFGLL